ncbi:FAD-binding domain protein [Rhizoctonia solani]|uniref:FAD-binding domain protein n=1 Tax=Rhizoctonia solani TaxID=456999 RepID=A0A8H8SZR9_9AGAM|nr:FAD-binding domain protein [Rhizoctonia solani]QRW22693.1 FAD-binding domain protein [Rhizoctonia solani]
MAHKSTLLFGALALSLAAAQSQDLATCLQQGSTNDTVILPSSFGYEAAAYATFNQRLLYNPTAVVYPTTAQDIQRYVRCAAASGVPIAARSGGHSYASYDLGGVDGAIVVDLSNMTSVVVHDDGTAYIQTGNRLGDMARKLWDQGRRSVPHGFVETVGTGGHISFGGMGAWSRRHGLAQDRVIGAEIVLANGTILTASHTNQPDLFWAIRGAAPSFGIVTQWIMDTLPTDPSVITYTVDYDAVTTSTQLSQIFQRWQATVASAPDESWLASRVARATTASDLTLQLRGVYFGTQDQFNAYTANWTTLFSPGRLSSQAHDWYGGIIAPLSTSTIPRRLNVFGKSLMTNDSVIPERWDSMCEYIFSAGMNASLPWWFESYSYGGAISRQGTDATSFASRDALFSYQWWGYTPANTAFPSDGISFVDGMLKALEPNPQKAYPNYVDPTLSADEWKQQYYGDHYERLARIKRAVDPNNVFRFAQSIEVAE